MVSIGVLAIVLAVPVFAQEVQGPPNQCFAEAVQYQYQKQAVSGGTVPTDLAYWGSSGFNSTSDGAGWFDEPQALIPADEAAGAGYTGTLATSGIPTNTNFTFSGSTWIYAETSRTVQGEQVPCIEIEVSSECGVVFGAVTENRTPFAAFVSAVIGENPLISDYPWIGPALAIDQNPLEVTFEEDFNGGSIVVTVLGHGPEQNYYAVNGVSAIFETITVDTDCEDPEPTTTTTVPEETTTTVLSGAEWTGFAGCEVDGRSTITVDFDPDEIERVFVYSENFDGTLEPLPDQHSSVFEEPGTFSARMAGDHDFLLVAEAAEGFAAFPESIALTAEPCPEPTTPATTPSTPVDPPEELPYTGVDPLPLSALALVLLATGGLVLRGSTKLSE